MSPLHADPPSEPSTELEVPAEVRRTNGGASHAAGCIAAAIFVLFPAFVYFGFFGVLLLDGVVLNTRFFGPDKIPQEVFDWLTIIYWPLIVLTRWALGMQ
jgi:hypothetical protein